MSYKILETKRKSIHGKIVVGIDPGKESHYAVVLDPFGAQLKSFTFAVNSNGYHKTLWKKLDQVIGQSEYKDVVFAIEISCNLWQTLVHYLIHSGHTVLMVSPLTTHHSRPMINHDFSHTDPKDALLIANSAQSGYFDFYKHHSAETNALHELGILYSKTRKTLQQQKARLRAYIEFVFPEFLKTLDLDSKTAHFLLRNYFLPDHYLAMDIESVGRKVAQVSRYQCGEKTLLALKKAAQNSIGVTKSDAEVIVGQLTINIWLNLELIVNQQLEKIKALLIEMAKKKSEFKFITSLSGISDLLAALFLSETRDLSLFKHWKQIEKLAGLNLRLVQSGKYVGRKRISHIGNRRLSWIIYWMCEQTSRSVPEVRIKFLRRQLRTPSYRKSIVACVPIVLKLITQLTTERRPYEFRDDTVEQVKRLNCEYEYSKNKKQKIKKKQITQIIAA